MYQPHFQGLLRFLVFTQQNHGCRVSETNQARRTLGAAGTRQQADVDFGKAQDCAGVTGQNPVVAGQADFQTTTQRKAVNRDRDGLAAGFHFA